MFVIDPQNLRQQGRDQLWRLLALGLTRPFNQWTGAINYLTPQVAPCSSTPNAGEVERSPTSTAMTYAWFIRASRQGTKKLWSYLASSHKLRVSRFGCTGHWKACPVAPRSLVQTSRLTRRLYGKVMHSICLKTRQSFHLPKSTGNSCQSPTPSFCHHGGPLSKNGTLQRYEVTLLQLPLRMRSAEFSRALSAS